MANYCYFELKIKGKKENVNKMVSYFKADYSYETTCDENYNREIISSKCTADKHFFRIFECEVVDEYFESDDGSYVILDGQCAWSVSSCMLAEDHSYYSDWIKSSLACGAEFKGSNVPLESKNLDLDVEIFSEETDFMEHYIIKKGHITTSETVDCEEIYDEESHSYKIIGGFKWEFSI